MWTLITRAKEMSLPFAQSTQHDFWPSKISTDSWEYLEGFDTRVKIVQLTLKLLHFQALLDVARVSLF